MFLPRRHRLHIACLVLALLGMMPRVASALSAAPAVAHPVVALQRATLTIARTTTRNGAQRLPAGWPALMYGGIRAGGRSGQPPTRIPSYSLAYPPGWTFMTWPDTSAGYGDLVLTSSGGSTIDLVLLPLRPQGPALAALVAHDATFLAHVTRDHVTVPLGTALRLAGLATPLSAGRASQILYLQRGGLVYRFLATYAVGSAERTTLLQVAATLHVPALPRRSAVAPTPTPPSQTCCHCPAWGGQWGRVLTTLDGVPIYWNAGDVDNGCTGTYGILYQCVELVQRYFAVRWGYPAIWSGVHAAADLRMHHPRGIQFIANGELPGPQEGDALLFYGGAFGHIALVKRVDHRIGQIDVVEENWSPTGQARLTFYGDSTIGIRDSAYGSYVVAGWLHSPKNLSAPATASELSSRRYEDSPPRR